MTEAASLYDQDFVAWTERQAALLRAGALDAIDAAHLAEEIESVGASERRELRRRLARLLQLMLKWHGQPDHRCRSRATTIQVQRDEIAAVLADSRSLHRTLPDLLPQSYRLGRGWAEQETGLLALPADCPWTLDQVLADDFRPD